MFHKDYSIFPVTKITLDIACGLQKTGIERGHLYSIPARVTKDNCIE
jgi:hypothetical protein